MKSIVEYSIFFIVIMSLVCSTGWAAGGFVEKGIYGAYQDTDALGDGLGAGAKLTIDTKDLLPVQYDLITGIDIRGNWLNNYGDDSQLLSVEGIYRVGLDMHSGLMPYIGAGAGGYFWHSDASEKYADVDDAFAGNAVVGVEKRLRPRTAFFVEGKYLYGDSDLQGFGANIGVNWHW